MKIKKVPLICRIRSKVYQSPSAILGRGCLIGVRHRHKNCNICSNYIPKIVHDGFIEGVRKGGIKMAMDKNIEFTINGNSTPEQTNYDRIKSMSVEEMAQELTEIEIVGYECMTMNGYEGWKQWLLQEVNDEKINR